VEAGVLPDEVFKQLGCQPKGPQRSGSRSTGLGKEASTTSGRSGSRQFDMHMVAGRVSSGSQRQYADPDQTIIIYDWDDTLCPSSCLKRFSQFDRKGRLAARLDGPTRSELGMLADQVAPLLRFSMAMGKVVIVTNARRPWVDISCSNFLPALKSTLKNIPVIYALELVKDAQLQQLEKEDSGKLLTETKARAMKAAVTEFYSRYPRQSWKNVVSIGDALFEHAAIRQVVGERPMQTRKCRTKTVKLLEGPSIAGLVVQLSIVESWLAKIVQVDGDVDIDMSANEDSLRNWSSLYGEETSA